MMPAPSLEEIRFASLQTVLCTPTWNELFGIYIRQNLHNIQPSSHLQFSMVVQALVRMACTIILSA